MLYVLFNFALRPFRRWWRRIIVAAVVGTLLIPAARQYVETQVFHRHETIVLPPDR
ncbi:MAG TPA: hypothetical protein VHD87_03465 [Acidimicrobiales bacterium]|nr:hypothetical protein [Acidimicrobiales bacterium]